jgi:hypothetical protein
MAKRVWQEIKVQNCEHAGGEVSLEAEVLYPDDQMPDTPPRVIAHRCSHGLQCGLMKEASCVWAGTNPTYDPFTEKQK